MSNKNAKNFPFLGLAIFLKYEKRIDASKEPKLNLSRKMGRTLFKCKNVIFRKDIKK